MAVPTLWRTKRERYSLQGQICPDCSSAIFPPRRVCPYCHNDYQHHTADASIATGKQFTMPMLLSASPDLAIAADD